MTLDPLYTAVSWTLLRWHDLFTSAGLAEQSGVNWALSIACLVLTIRLLLLPVFVRQLHHQRAMQALAPQLARIRSTHAADRAAQQRAIAEVQPGSPLIGCLPMLLQVPIFIALLQVLRHLANSAGIAEAVRSGQPVAPKALARLRLYGFSQHETMSAAQAKVFGAPLAASIHRGAGFVETLLGGELTAVRLAIILVVAASAAAAYLTQRLARAGNPVQPDGASAAIARLTPVIVPVSVVCSGLFFPLGLIWYWCVSNLCTLGQQVYVNRFHPHPELLSPRR